MELPSTQNCMDTAFEDYMNSRNLVPLFDAFKIKNQPDLGLDDIGTLALKSEGVSGDALASGSLTLNNQTVYVVIKFFRVPCQYKTIVHGNKIICRPQDVIDKNQYEMGNTMLLTDIILLNEKHLTPHITFAFKSGVCTSGYETEVSMCNPNNLIEPNSFLIPSNCDSLFSHYPQCAFRSDYMNRQLDDSIRYLIVEKVNGDLEQWITDHLQEDDLPISEFDHILLSMLVMITYTLYVLDDYLEGFLHGDMGPRNILFTNVQASDKYWKYEINNKAFYIQAHGTVPKLWDFSNTYIGSYHKEHFNYIKNTNNRDVKPFTEDLSILLKVIRNRLNNSQTSLLPIIDHVLSCPFELTNKEMAMYFLNHEMITKHFTGYVPDYLIEHTFSYVDI